MHPASRRRHKNAKVLSRANRDQAELRSRVVAKGKPALPGARTRRAPSAKVAGKAGAPEARKASSAGRAEPGRRAPSPPSASGPVAARKPDVHQDTPRHVGPKVPTRALVGLPEPHAAHRSTSLEKKAMTDLLGPSGPQPRQATAAADLKHLLLASNVPREKLTTAMARPVPGATGWERHVLRRATAFPLKEFRLSGMTDAELADCSKALGIRLSLQEMKDARAYFQGKGRNPTDVEMEALGQAWSEHCCYKSSKPVLKRHVYGIAEERIICREDAGVLPFDGDWYYSPKLESHNHPSAVEPYGGAATGIGGVLRDVLCMGAQPVALIDPLFFGPLDTRQDRLPAGVKHPRFLMGGVVEGIRDYGNRVGIPTVAGGITFHKGYTGNCLVNVGCVGVLHKSQLTHSRAGGVGDLFVYLGNPTGRDGIHGVAFASEELSEASEEASRSAVQVGDAILKEPLIHVVLQVIAEGLATGCKDFGGGGLSCVAGELAYDAGYGCEIQLDKVPTKVPGMAPWEIWVSESQERMMVTAKPADVERILHIAKLWDVPAAVVGTVIAEPVNRAFHHGEKVLEFDLAFSTGGPVYDRPVAEVTVRRDQWLDFPAPDDLGKVLEWMMGHPNVMSKEWAIRQYDHEVRAATVLKPLQGVIGSEGPGDAAVLKPVAASDKGLAICSDVNPEYCLRDPYWGAASAVDEVVRNLAAVGARLSSFCDNLNFGNPEKPERMWELYESARGLGDMARVLDRPFASGNVSLYNEGPSGPIPPTPTVMGVGILEHYRNATTMDLKEPGNRLYVVGHTLRDLGGSLYLQHLRLDGERVPQSDAEMLRELAERIVQGIEKGFIRSAHDCSEGGLAVTLAEMCFAGRHGADVDLAAVGLAGDESRAKARPLRSDLKLFSESNTRWVVEVPADKAAAWEAWWNAPIVKGALQPLGTVEPGERLKVRDGRKTLIDVDTSRLRRIWSTALPRLMGVASPAGASPATAKATPAARPHASAQAPGKAHKSARRAMAKRPTKTRPTATKRVARKAVGPSRPAKPSRASRAVKPSGASKAAKPAKAAKAKGVRK